MKKELIFLCSLISIAPFANAYENYAKYSILYTIPSSIKSKASNNAKDELSIKSGFALEASIGKKITKNIALESQYTYDKADVKDYNANIKVQSIFSNIVYNFDVKTKLLKPYVGLGLGGAHFSDGSKHDNVFAYQGFIGTSFYANYNMEFFLEYKYKEFKNVEIENIKYSNTKINGFAFGLKSKF